MLKDAVAVIDVGSYSLTALIGENGINNNFTIRAIRKCVHDAFDGDKINEGNLYNAVSKSLKSVSASAKARLNKVYVGVPGEFLRLFNTEQRAFYNRKKRIRPKDLTEFFDGACHGLDTGDYEIISRNAVCFLIDGGLRCDDVLGLKTSSLSSYVSVYGARRDFMEIMRKMLKSLKVDEVVFIPVTLAEGSLLFTKEERRTTQILLDVGYSTSQLTVLSGDGALFERVFPVGGGHITAYLYDKFNVEFDVAERLKRKINLSIHMDVGNYVVLYGDEQYNFPVSSSNDVTRYVIDAIAEDFDKAILNSRVKLPHNVSVSITGGGISYIRGGAEYLSGRIEMPVNIVRPKTAYMSKPDDSSSLAVLNYALNHDMF